MKSSHQLSLKKVLSCMVLGTVLIAAVLLTGISCNILPAKAASAQAFTVTGLQVEYTPTPIGIEDKNPRFSWQMTAPEGQRDYSQAAYQLVVKEPKGTVVWDTGKVTGDIALGLVYAGTALKAVTRYNWTVTVWNNKGQSTSQTSWFETGLMNPDSALAAWDGANWIGGSNDDLVFYSHYLSICRLTYTQAIEPGSSKASFILGANDIRLMDKNKNTFQVESPKDGSYVKIELDISTVDGSENGKAKLNIYRVGYTNTDLATKPFRSFDVATTAINNDNKHSVHTFEINDTFGSFSISLDGNSSALTAIATENQQGGRGARGGMGGRGGGGGGASVLINPMGSGGDLITFGMICDIGFAMDAGQKASFSKIEVFNSRSPGNKLFSEDLTKAVYSGIYADSVKKGDSGLTIKGGRYAVDGGSNGVMITADPSRNSTPVLRTEFKTSVTKIATARLYITARGIYEFYINGKIVGNDNYNPGFTDYNRTHMYQIYDVTDMLKSGDNAAGAMLGEGWWSGLLSFGTIWNHFGDRQSLLAKIVINYQDGSSQVITTNEKNWKYYNKGPIVYSSLDMGEIYDATREIAIEGWNTAGYDDSKWANAVIVPLAGTAYQQSAGAAAAAVPADAGIRGFEGMDLNATGGGRGGRGGMQPFSFANMKLVAQIGNNVGEYQTLTAKSVKKLDDGTYIYNMGQNFVGVPKITIKNGKAGQKIVLRFSEMLYPEMPEYGKNVGNIMTENYRAALCQDIYTMKDGNQVFQPHFTYRGYQYIQITGLDDPLPLDAVQGIARSSIRQLTSNYETSNTKVNKLWSNLVWSNVDNFLSIPTDCPQRNERMGWSGDISVFSRTATFLSSADQFIRRHMIAMRNTQGNNGKFTDIAPVGGGFGGVLWGSAGVTVPWEAYQQYNDVRLLEEHYDAMAKYVDYVATTTDQQTGVSSDSQLGDWLGPQVNATPSQLLTSTYYVYDLWIVAKSAEILGKTEDAKKYWSIYEEYKRKLHDTFVNKDNQTVRPASIGGGRGGRGGMGGGTRGGGDATPVGTTGSQVVDTQTSYAVGLALGVFDKDKTAALAKNLSEAVKRQNVDDSGTTRPVYSLMTGFIGTAWISKALSDYGYVEDAYRLLQNNQYPSWLYAVDQGATSIWERLNGYTIERGFGGQNGMNSFNHYSFGAVGQWMIAYSLGIQRDPNSPGFKHFILQPEYDPSGQMTWAKGYYDSVYSRISSDWKVDKGVLTYKATVPANTTATLYIPASSASGVTEGGKPANKAEGIKFIKYEKGKAIYELKSGSYELSSKL
jgi:alpha-L-rhamnosidase